VTRRAMNTITDIKSKQAAPEQHDAFKDWQQVQGIPILGGFFIADVNDVELKPWALKGVPGALIVLEGTGGQTDAHVCEIPPGAKTAPQKHLFEETVYVSKGHGATTVWQGDGPKHTFEWGPGSLFALPLNASHQHFNASSREPARYFAVTNSCFMMRLFHNHDFIFNNDFAFSDRFRPEQEDYFSSQALYGRHFMSTNFVPDTRTFGLAGYDERGKGSTNMKFDLASNTMAAHISEFPVGTYKKCHRHGPGAHVIILSGQGYSHMYPDGEEPQRFDWQPGSVVVPPNLWWHQHFNAGAIPARYLAIRWNNWRYKSVMHPNRPTTSSFTSVKKGGAQIEFDDEDPNIHREFEAALKQAGARCAMGEYHPYCTEKI
jgi:uncharacterized RmlC-like cupin family protein